MAERIGIIFVHGIGEQKRYEHLDGEVRDIIRALEVKGCRATVDLRDGRDAAFLGEQNTWQSDPNNAPVRVLVRALGEPDKHLFLHEVWWADVNEPYSLGKQVRFWGW